MSRETLREEYDRTKMWYDSAIELLKGRTITNVWWQEWDEEYPEEGTGLVFKTDKDDAFFVSSDDEGNGPGVLHVGTSKERKKELQKKRTYVTCLPVGVASNSEYIKMWQELNHIKS